MRFAPHRALLLLGIAASTSLLAALQACSSGDDPRKGGVGESCTRTDDCASPLSCIDAVCTDGAVKPDGGGTGGGSSTGTGGSGGIGPVSDGGPFSACGTCLETACEAELVACDDECLAIEACIETVCPHLSAIDAPKEEGSCQAKCQDEHAGAEAKHLAVVNCVNAAACSPPCVPYPGDDDVCRSFMDKSDCKAARAACKGSPDCQQYLDCVSACTTFKDCIACDDTAAGQAGRALLQDYQQCLATRCIVTSWLPPP